MECPLHSGTLITCTRAVEQGRAVMAVPGRIDWRTSEGCHHLIREGARMVTSVDDIVEELTPLSARAKAAASAAARNAEAQRRDEKQTAPEEKVEPLVGCGPAKASRRASVLPESKISSEEASVLRAVPEEGATMDAVARACGLGAACVSALLVGLRLKGRVRLLPGNRVAPARPH